MALLATAFFMGVYIMASYLKAKIEHVNSYNITIDGVEHRDFKKGEEWEGMVVFKNPTGEIILDIQDPDPFSKIFGEIFNIKPATLDEKAEVQELRIVKVSNSLMSEELKEKVGEH